jgi:hypothetical protein
MTNMNVPPQGPPSEFTNYPRQGFGGGGSTRGPGVYFDYIGTAFEIIRKNPGVFVVGALVYLVLSSVVQMPTNIINGGRMEFGASVGFAVKGKTLFGLIVNIISSLLSICIHSAFSAGFAKATIEQMDTGNTRFETIFSGFKNIGNTIGASIISSILIGLGFLLCFVPGFYVIGRLAFAPYLCAIEGIGCTESLQKSSAWTQPYAWSMFGLLFVTGLVSFLGVFACCVGLLWTTPIVGVVIGLHYRDFRGLNQTNPYA